jgi:ATP-dependent Zn protease
MSAHTRTAHDRQGEEHGRHDGAPPAEPLRQGTERGATQNRLLREAERRAITMLTDHRPALDRLTKLLLERETIDGTDVEAIVGLVHGPVRRSE